MKKNLLNLLMMLVIFAGTQSLMAQWAQYNADALPHEDPTVNVKDGGLTLVTGTSEIVVDPDDATNNLWKINVEVPPDEIKHEWYPSYWDLSSTENTAVPAPTTIACKFRWIDTTFTIGPELEFRTTAKVQTKIFKKDGMFKLEAKDWGPDINYNLPETFDPTQWHVLRLTLNDLAYNIYIDENPTPFVTGTSGKPLTKHLVVFGAFADDGKTGVFIDWMGFLDSEASSPTEMPLPAGIFEWNPGTAVNALDATEMLSVYPNPTSEILTVSVGNDMLNSRYELMDITGKLVRKGLLHAKINTIDVSAFNSGMYFLRVISGEKVMSDSFIVK